MEFALKHAVHGRGYEIFILGEAVEYSVQRATIAGKYKARGAHLYTATRHQKMVFIGETGSMSIFFFHETKRAPAVSNALGLSSHMTGICFTTKSAMQCQYPS